MRRAVCNYQICKTFSSSLSFLSLLCFARLRPWSKVELHMRRTELKFMVLKKIIGHTERAISSALRKFSDLPFITLTSARTILHIITDGALRRNKKKKVLPVINDTPRATHMSRLCAGGTAF